MNSKSQSPQPNNTLQSNSVHPTSTEDKYAQLNTENPIKKLNNYDSDNDFLKFEKRHYSKLKKRAKSRQKQYENSLKIDNVKANQKEMERMRELR